MALQTDNLVAYGLGIQGDTPPNSAQPRLVDGVHLRWFFDPELGFPRYGFYILRRPALNPTLQQISASTQMRALAAGAAPASPCNLGTGRLSASGGSLATVDTFAPTGLVEFKLDTAQAYDFALVEAASLVEVKIGVNTALTAIRVQALFDGVVMAETTASGVAASVVTVRLQADRINAVRLSPVAGSENKAVLIDIGTAAISANARVGWRVLRALGAPLGLPVFHPNYPLARGAAPNFNNARALETARVTYGTPPGAARIITQTGTVTTTAGSPLVAGSGTAWDSSLVGAALRVSGDQDAYIITAVLGAGRLALSRPITGASLAGAAYQILDDPFAALYDDAMQLVWQGSGASPMHSRSLPDAVSSAGTAAVTQGSASVVGTGTGWSSAMVGLRLQLARSTAGSLALTPGSATVVGSGTSWDESLVGGLLQVAGDATLFTIASVESPTLLQLERAYLGAGGAGLSYVVFEDRGYTISAVASPTQLTLSEAYAEPAASGRAYRIFAPLGAAGGDGVALQRHYPLELLLLGSLDPATAQTLGLYWVDASAQPGVAYDYLVMADYTNRAKLDVWNALELAKAGRFDNGLEAYLVSNRKVQPQATLPAPGELKLYSLPGVNTTNSIPGRPGFNGNSVGLRWNQGLTAEGYLLPDRPIFYHLWRANLGQSVPSAQPAASSYSLITANAPLVVGQPEIEGYLSPERPTDWPPFAMHAFDNAMADGWYSYKVSAVDMFGRHSLASAPGQWVIWNPRPTPLPWYARGVTGDTIHGYAIELLDLLAPPVPTAVEAYTLDHDDPTLVQDAAYTTWRAQAGMASTVGIRVRWRWTPQHMLQAPDTKEFRIYLHPGSTLPAQPNTVVNWRDRLAVISLADTTAYTVEADGARLYDVLLPRASGDTFFSTPPLAVSAATPLAFASVAVSAADDKTHRMAVDPRGSAGRLAGRTGNEGQVGQPGKIFRVHRVPPARPELPAPSSANVYASPADYHSQSFYTYRWKRPADTRERTHIFRAMDDTLFKADWDARPQPALAAGDLALFPPAWQGSDNAGRRQAIVDALNQLNTHKGTYNAATTDAARLAARGAAFAYYRGLSNDALLVLASLKSNEAAFTQLTTDPLNPALCPDKKGPDSPASYAPDATLCAFVDALDGRASNRYFYRSASMNAVHARSAELSLATPPVWLPDVQPPRAPSICEVLGGERVAHLMWTSNREPDLREYRVYRAESAVNARDIRLMTLVYTETVGAGAPEDRPGAISWTDTALRGGVDYYYRLVAVDNAGNVSAPSDAARATVVDTRPPAPPAWKSIRWVVLNPDNSEAPWPSSGVPAAGQRAAVRVEWSNLAPGASFVVMRKLPGEQLWKTVANKQGYATLNATDHLLYDTAATPDQVYQYRIRTISPIGIPSNFFREIQVAKPAV